MRDTVHPRVCGELALGPLSSLDNSGSSPRVWGTPINGRSYARLLRFIPACVGNSSLLLSEIKGVAVHPRVCGELPLNFRVFNQRYGSSPRVWGTRLYIPFYSISLRFIPACVGNSLGVMPNFSAITVHPRVCGELLGRSIELTDLAGSSPRVWGTLTECWLHDRWPRFIPACVGNSLWEFLAADENAVHPRVCGELFFAYHGQHGGCRFIPACVGNSTRLTT